MVANYGTAMSNYRNMVQFGDTLEDSSLGLSSFGGNLAYNPLSMNGSILSPGILGGGNYYGAGDQAYYNMTPLDRVQADEKVTNETIKSQYNVTNLANGLQRQNKASEDFVTRAVGILHDLAANDRQDQIPAAYANLLKAVKDRYTEEKVPVTEDQIKATAEEEYSKATGQRLTDDINQHGTPQFVHGLEQGFLGLGWLLTDNKTAKDNAALINSQPVSKGDQFANIAGIVVSGALSLLALPLLLKGGKQLGGFALGKSAEAWKSLFKPKELETLAKVIK